MSPKNFVQSFRPIYGRFLNTCFGQRPSPPRHHCTNKRSNRKQERLKYNHGKLLQPYFSPRGEHHHRNTRTKTPPQKQQRHKHHEKSKDSTTQNHDGPGTKQKQVQQRVRHSGKVCTKNVCKKRVFRIFKKFDEICLESVFQKRRQKTCCSKCV